MALNIIGGKFRNRPLKAPKGEQTRPTSAILRKSVFDICRPYLEGANFLDLYAGTGAMGLEALSQGASKATFVEIDRHALECLRANIHLLQLEAQTSLLKGDVFKVVSQLEKTKKTFDLIYIDPPYAFIETTLELLKLIDSSHLLAPDGLLFIEEGIPSQLHPEKLEFLNLILHDSRKCGKSLLHQYRKSF